MADSANPDALVGMQLGSCVLEKPLGVGGMGAVYLARQERPRRPVAVKVLRPQLAESPDAWRVFLARFRLEADATAALDHANIVPIYEFGEADDLAYLVMPFLADGSLAALLAREWMLPIPRAVRYTEHIAAALDYAHQHGIVHRDVKPSNLLLHPDGRLLLADFGIARLMDRSDGDSPLPPLAPYGEVTLTQTGSAMGTPEYMSPEQVRGEAAGAAADIYALGIVTYVMLAGRSPFAGGDVKAVLTRQLADPPLPLRPLRGEVTTRMEEVIFWALAKDPKDRPATAGEFASALAVSVPRGRTLAATLRRSATAIFPATSQESDHRAPGPAEHPRGRPSMGTLPLSAARGLAAAEALSPSAAGGEPPTIGGDATLTNGAAPWPSTRTEGAPTWPVQPRYARDAPETHHFFGLPLAALAAAVIALALVATLVLGSLAQGGFGGLNGAPGTAHSGALATAASSPTITPQPTATSTPFPANWLTVSPQSVSLSCRGKGTTKYVTLRNLGPDQVQWQSDVTHSGFTTPLVVRPEQGGLDSGDQVSIALTVTSFFTAQGQVTFTPSDSSAGQPAVVSYTISGGCL